MAICLTVTKKLTDMARFFLEPANATHRQYEALRAYFVEGLTIRKPPSASAIPQGSFRVLVHEFRQNPNRPFFLPPAKGPQKAPKKDKVRDEVIALRKQNLSIYDISRALESRAASSARSPSPDSQGRRFRPTAPKTRRGTTPRGHGPTSPRWPTSDTWICPHGSSHTKFGGLFSVCALSGSHPFR